jgi:succinyl-CoA synthetase beta subunit
MKLLEYEAKEILREGGLPVPSSSLVRSVDDIVSFPTVLKSQVPIGGRGKLGGIKIVETKEAFSKNVSELLSLKIKGFMPTILLAEEKLDIVAEHYVSLFVDRSTATIRLMAHKNGGVEIEENNNEDFLNIPIDSGSIDSCAEELAGLLGYDLDAIKAFLTHLYDAFIKNDALLLEINPLIYTKNQELICGDCKMELDDAAKFRHPDWNFEEKVHDANFVVLSKKGTVATIANGAGLAMATVDAVSNYNMVPSNFLDIGGGANTESVLKAFRKIVEFKDIQAIVINIFAGITRCDEVARAIIEAKKQIDTLPPLFIRLAGTSFEEAVELLAKENIPTLATLEECLEAAKKAHHA